ncbi:L-serine dehydratase [Aphanothece sacrum FPU1]|uniref:L-serine dehydratase n=1 Tax=Aphanothece sacrum FPU1 TaxID=1920663 RepID=A0A401IKM4_APHSA|nr:L-serine dehydratase [Aphanothece sacrum FPU1]GBF85098.1 L-serine dehydratase [Aphanothece sacrum FPU3]
MMKARTIPDDTASENLTPGVAINRVAPTQSKIISNNEMIAAIYCISHKKSIVVLFFDKL